MPHIDPHCVAQAAESSDDEIELHEHFGTMVTPPLVGALLGGMGLEGAVNASDAQCVCCGEGRAAAATPQGSVFLSATVFSLRRPAPPQVP